MYARILTTESKPGLGLDPDDTVALWENHLAAIFKNASGFRGAYVLGNAGDQRAMTITLWDRDEDADNSGTFEEVLAHIRDTLAVPPMIDGYDVIYSISEP